MAVQRGSVNALVKKFETHELDFDEPEEPYTYVPSPRIDDLKNYFETLGARDNSNWKKPRKERPAVEEPDHEVSTKVMEKILDFEPDAFEAESESLDNDYVPKLQDEKPADLDPVTTRATEKIGTSMEMEVDVVRRYLSGVQAYVFDNVRSRRPLYTASWWGLETHPPPPEPREGRHLHYPKWTNTLHYAEGADGGRHIRLERGVPDPQQKAQGVS